MTAMFWSLFLGNLIKISCYVRSVSFAVRSISFANLIKISCYVRSVSFAVPSVSFANLIKISCYVRSVSFATSGEGYRANSEGYGANSEGYGANITADFNQFGEGYGANSEGYGANITADFNQIGHLGLLQTVIFYPNRQAEGLRCAYCDSVISPAQCTEETECDMDQMCQTHAVFNVVYEMRYQMNCFSKMGCDAISRIPHTSGGLCVKCCDTPFCNLDICETGKTTPQTTPTILSTTMITTTTATTPLGTTTPPTTTFPTTKTTISTTPTTTTPATHPTPKQTLPVVHVNHVYYAKYGETLSIACSVTGNPVPSVHWKKLGSDAVLSSTPTLIIHHASEIDQGQYACVAKNALGTALAVTSVFVTNVPTTTTTHSVTTTIPTTHPTTSTTTIKPTTHPTTTTKPTTHPTTTTKPTTHSTTSTTTTQPTTHSTASTTTHIHTTITTHAPVKLIAPTEQVVWHGDNLSTFCQVIGDGMVHVKWTVLFGTEAGNVQTENGILEIRNAQPYNEGIYVCSIDGPNVVRTYTHIRVNGSAPEIKKSPSDQTIEEQTSLRLFCEFSGHPEPEIQWEVTTQSKRFIVSTRHAEERMHVENRGHILVIQTAMVTDSGVYSCIGTNYYGRKSMQMHLRVQPKLTTTHFTTVHSEPPRVSMIDKEVVLNGFDLTLTCSFTGIPSPTISWIFNGNHHLPANTITFSNFLTIRDARLNNSGTYTCHAENSVGSANAETKLQVFGMPPMITKAPVSVSLNRGALLTLSCDASALPRPIISWKFHSHAKGTSALISNSDGSGALLSAENTKLVIHQAQYAHSGVYTCTASNDYGSAEANATVYVR